MNYTTYHRQLNTLLDSLSGQKPPRLVLIWGSSALFINEALSALKAAWLAREDRQYLCLEPSDWAEEVKFGQLVGQGGLFEAAPLYHLRHGERVDKWWQYFTRLPREGEQLFCLTIFRDKLAPASKTLQEKPLTLQVSCFPPQMNELSPYLGQLLKRAGLKLSREASHLLLTSTGDDESKLANEVTKLGNIFAANAAEISADSLAPYLGLIRDNHVFQLTKHLLAGNYSKAQLLCQELLLRRESAISLVGLLTRHTRLFLYTEEAKHRHWDLSQQARLFKLPLGVLRDYAQSRHRPAESTLRRSLQACQQADMALKSTQALSPELILTQLLETIAGR